MGILGRLREKFTSSNDVPVERALISREEFDSLCELVVSLDRHNKSLRFDNHQLRCYREDNEVWMWQPEEDNHLESLACPILIMPADLKELLQC